MKNLKNTKNILKQNYKFSGQKQIVNSIKRLFMKKIEY